MYQVVGLIYFLKRQALIDGIRESEIFIVHLKQVIIRRISFPYLIDNFAKSASQIKKNMIDSRNDSKDISFRNYGNLFMA